MNIFYKPINVFQCFYFVTHAFLIFKLYILSVYGKIHSFLGTVNYSEAKIKIFQDGLGLDPSLLDCVKITYNKCPVVTYKLKSEINVATSIKNQLFNFSRIYSQLARLNTARGSCTCPVTVGPTMV